MTKWSKTVTARRNGEYMQMYLGSMLSHAETGVVSYLLRVFYAEFLLESSFARTSDSVRARVHPGPRFPGLLGLVGGSRNYR